GTGTATITASSSLSNPTQNETITPDVASKLAFTTAAQSIVAGAVSTIITVQSQDSNNNPSNVTADTTVTLSSSHSVTGVFTSDAVGLTPITTVTITNGSNSASFYYKDTLV